MTLAEIDLHEDMDGRSTTASLEHDRK